jgi:hypothetical protein
MKNKQLKQNPEIPSKTFNKCCFIHSIKCWVLVRHGVLLSQTELLQKCIRYQKPIHQYLPLSWFTNSGKPIVISSLWCLSFIKFFYPACFCLTTYFDSFDVAFVNFGKLTFNTTPWGKLFSKTSRVIFQ